ncbi:MAG: discoidin domain-containing protein [Clostridia bacterium]|nr:discoidin domain-containing protein [Clostridia bacterium]
MKKILALILALLMIFTVTAMAEGEMASDEMSIEGYKVHVSSQNAPGGTPREKGENVLDSDTVSHWHSSIEPKAEGPHFITIEMPEKTAIGGYRYYPRSGGGAGVCTQYEIYLSNDNENFQKVAEGTWEKDDTAKTVEFSRNYNAKFVRLQLVKADFGYGSAGEIRILAPKSGSAPLEITANVKASEIGGAASAPSAPATPAAPAAGGKTMNIDYISSEKVSGKAMAADEMDPVDWLFQVSSANSPKGVPYEKPENVVDGDMVTHWHSAIDPKANPPHYFTIILPEETEFSGFRYYPRKSSVGVCVRYEIYISNDNENFEKVAEGSWKNDDSAKTAEFTANYKAKYVRLQYVEGTGGYATAGEMRLLAPKASLPSKGITNASVKRASLAAVQKEETKAPATNEPKSTVLSEDELPVTGWTFDASSINANNGIPNEVPEKTIDGDLTSHWHTMINPKAIEPHYITIILPEEQAVSGYRYYPRKNLGAGVCTEYEIHVSPDGESFKKVAEGAWAYNEKAKTVYFNTNIKAKAVKLVLVHARDAYGSAGEIRLLKENPSLKTITAKDLIEKSDEYSYVAVKFPGISVKTDKIENQPSSLMIDGNSESYYHSEITNNPGRLPITIDFNLGYAYTLSGLGYQPRLDGNLTGHFEEIEIEYSLDGKNYEFYDSYVMESDSTDPKSIMFDEPLKARYIRVIVIKGRGNYATCGEFKFYQTEGDYKREALEDDVSYVLQIGSKDITVNKNGEKKVITTDVAPFIFKNYTMIPLRGLLEQMGASINWIEYDQKIEVITESEDLMLFQIEDDRVYINDTRYNAQVAPIIKDGRTFIPLRFVSENMGYKVAWDGATQTITISYE